jgi:hypothetical protein
MTRNFLVFIFGIFLLLVFSFAFCFAAIYSEILIAGIFACVGFLACFIMSIAIGMASRDEGGMLYIWFFAIATVTAILTIWYLTRAGTLLQIW